MKKSKVLFLLPYPLERAPSQRFRVEAYFKLLKEGGICFDAHEFLDKDAWKILYQKGSLKNKIVAVIKGFKQRFFICLRANDYSYVFIHREAAPLGPPLFEWIISRVLRVKIIYDFDDAIWVPNVSEGNKLARSFKCHWKIKFICKWAYKVSVGNEFLAAYARQFNKNVIYNPTCVDTETRYNILAEQNNSPVIIGWTGSHSTLQFLEILHPVLMKLEKTIPFKLRVICDKKPDFELSSMEFVPWSSEREIDDLAKFDIGIMPLKDDAWSEGKCGFKIIQYFSLGIPAVASPVGVNKRIIEHGVNGYLCSTEQEWIDRLVELIRDKQKRLSFGKKGRERIIKNYSLTSNACTVISLFSN